MARHLILVSAATQTCGVEEFARQTAVRLGSEGATYVLDRGLAGFGAALRSADDVVINLPLLAWKRHPLLPILAAARARLAGRDVTLVLHEWADLALARRVTYLPLLPLVTRLLFSSPEIMAQFAATPVS
ncbi:MAG TPA: glycosyltransferase family 1 protein, partial [Devosia sp.]|nr:glycosyltransferase family 1 protein [Devosia sp.]